MVRRVFPKLRISNGRFGGSRVNLESVPRLPALAVRMALDDPLRRTYLFVWKLDDRFVNGVGEIVETVGVGIAERLPASYPDGPVADIRRIGEEPVKRFFLRTRYRSMPRGLGYELLLVCHSCERPKRFLYCW